MNISILLPFKENYSKEIAGAVSLFVKDTSSISSFKNTIQHFRFDVDFMIFLILLPPSTKICVFVVPGRRKSIKNRTKI